jgi:hypothetical protein
MELGLRVVELDGPRRPSDGHDASRVTDALTAVMSGVTDTYAIACYLEETFCLPEDPDTDRTGRRINDTCDTIRKDLDRDLGSETVGHR